MATKRQNYYGLDTDWLEQSLMPGTRDSQVPPGPNRSRRDALSQFKLDLLAATTHTDSFERTAKVWDFVSKMPDRLKQKGRLE